MKGKIIKIVSDSFQLKISITIITNDICIRSAAIIKRPWLKILAIVSMSFTALVTNRPTEDLSKYDILKSSICLNN